MIPVRNSDSELALDYNGDFLACSPITAAAALSIAAAAAVAKVGGITSPLKGGVNPSDWPAPPDQTMQHSTETFLQQQ